tara:strand:+ start:980 stop:1792 length:813 start_codon:yes stop_codon:yes gene_type:complete
MNNFYVVGSPIVQSKSPILFHYIFKKLNINKTYGSHNIKNIKMLSRFIEQCIQNKITGLNVTMPLKETINNYITIYDQTAQITKAVNCIYFKNNEVIGYNNDYFGFTKLAELNNISFKNSNNIVIGSGGSARSIVLSLIRNNADNIYILARNTESSKVLINDFSLIKKNTNLNILSNQSNLTNCNLINCSPINMLEKTSLEILNLVPLIQYNAVIDINYNTSYNHFNFDASKNINGKSMFIFQALKSLDIWFETKISNKLSYKELEKILC